MQSDGNSLCGYVVFGSDNMAYRDVDSILDLQCGNSFCVDVVLDSVNMAYRDEDSISDLQCGAIRWEQFLRRCRLGQC